MIAAFFVWWVGQLADLLPASLRRAVLANPDALVIDASSWREPGDIVSVSQRRAGREAFLGNVASTPTELAAIPSPPQQMAVLRLSPHHLLEKIVPLPVAAQAELDQVLAFEMDRETPFAVEELYWTHVVSGIDRQRGQLLVHLLFVPKIVIEPLLAILAQNAIAPRSIEVPYGAGECAYLPVTIEGGRWRHRSRRLIWAAATLFGVLASVAIGLPFVQQARELARLDSDIEAGRATAAEAEGLRREIGRLSRSAGILAAEIEKTGRPLATVAAATRLLPDGTYLTELELRQKKLTIGGRSDGAARLIAALAADSRFHNPAFAAPVTRLEALHAEIFSITADIEDGP